MNSAQRRKKRRKLQRHIRNWLDEWFPKTEPAEGMMFIDDPIPKDFPWTQFYGIDFGLQRDVTIIWPLPEGV